MHLFVSFFSFRSNSLKKTGTVNAPHKSSIINRSEKKTSRSAKKTWIISL